ncbi:ATPase [Candidatus Gracilibacteria bacterium 28_42_T64]|nr:ATPase [Candidatus Gracilibacteria bacterium 28_42_T64]
MAQVGIREFDAKAMYYESIGENYAGYQIKKTLDISLLSPEKKYVIKPDMLFGKRGKRGLLGLKLDKNGVNNWLHNKLHSKVNIDGVDGELDVFLAEEFSPLTKEYYISFSQDRDGDTLTFSSEGGIDIEENWNKTTSIVLSPLSNLHKTDLEKIGIDESSLQKIITKLWNFYRNYGFVYLEINPLGVDKNGNFIIVDMVAKVDNCEFFRQKDHWKTLELPQSFGYKENKKEKYIRELDAQTGASMKFKILNKDAEIWTLLAGGGGSLVITDTLGSLGFADEIGNYGELSGNPDRENTREYTRALIEQMLENNIKGKYLIIAGAIANFTKIDTTFAGIIDILEEKAVELQEQKIQILVRRGGLNDKKGLTIIKEACDRLGLPIKIANSDIYMTDILKEITL